MPPLLRVCFIVLAFFNNTQLTIRKAAFFAVSFLIYCTIGNWAFFDLLFVGILYDNIDYNKFVKCIMLSSIIAIVFILILYYVNVLPSLLFEREDGTVRESFGFVHPNALGRMVMCLCMMYISLVHEHFGIKDFLIMLAAVAFVVVYPNSITAAFVIFFLIIGELLYITNYRIRKNDAIDSKILKNISIVLPFFLATVFTFVMIKYNQSSVFAESFPLTIKSRIFLGDKAIDRYGIHVLPQHLELTSSIAILTNNSMNDYFVIDCFYYYLPIQFGIIATLYLVAEYYICMFHCISEKNFVRLFICICILVYGISENALLSSSSILFSFAFMRIGKKSRLKHWLKYEARLLLRKRVLEYDKK